METTANFCKYQTKVISSDDTSQCYSKTSVASFRQGIFPVDGFDLDNLEELRVFLREHEHVISRMACFLLKHPFLDFAPSYFFFNFAHHSQIGFKFYDEQNNVLRHFVFQLQNFKETGANTSVSPTHFWNLGKPCTVLQKGTNQVTQRIDFVEPSMIYGNLLESADGISHDLVTMNKDILPPGWGYNFPIPNVMNMNFYLESYLFWRLKNTAIPDTEREELLKGTKHAKILEHLEYKQHLGQTSKTCNKDGQLLGTSDGSLFVLNSFGPAFLSMNEGTILHFADVTQTKSGSIADKFDSFASWVYGNYTCSENKFTQIRSFSRTYVVLSTMCLSIDWVKALRSRFTDCKSIDADAIAKATRPFNGSYSQTHWSKLVGWDDTDQTCKDFELALEKIVSSRNVCQLMPSKGGYDYGSAPLVRNSETYNCEIFSSDLITMILNTDTFNSNGCKVERKFDFTFPNAPFRPSQSLEAEQKTDPKFRYSGQKIANDADMNVEMNLHRHFAANWPVAVFEPGYETGVTESEFNSKDAYKQDRETYTKMSLLFQFLMQDLDLEAAKTSDNPLLKAIALFFTAPMVSDMFEKETKLGKTMVPMMRDLMYMLFLIEIVGFQEFFLIGYPQHDMTNDTFALNKTYTCEPSVYKFTYGKSRAGIANMKMVKAWFGWMLDGKENARASPLFPHTGEENKMQRQLQRIQRDIATMLEIPKEILKKCTSCEEKDKNPLLEVKNKIECLMCKTDKLFSIVSPFTELIGDSVDAFMDIVLSKLSTKLDVLENLANFTEQKGVLLIDMVIGCSNRFVTFTHANYEHSENILYRRYDNTDETHAIKGIGLYRRPSTGVCSNILCTHFHKQQEAAQTHSFKVVQFGGRDAVLNMSDPYHKINAFKYATASAIAFIALWIGLLVWRQSRMHKRSTRTVSFR